MVTKEPASTNRVEVSNASIQLIVLNWLEVSFLNGQGL